MIAQYRPRLLARGGEHLVYAIPDHPRLVVKVSTRWARRLGADPPAAARQTAQQIIRRDARRFARLRDYFGAAHTLPRRKFLRRVPVEDDLAAALPGGFSVGTGVWTVLTVQRHEPALQRHDLLAVASGYAEFGAPDAALYRQVTIRHVLCPADPNAPDMAALLAAQAASGLRRLLAAAGNDHALYALLRELIGRVMAYSASTGETLDLASNRNLIVWRDGKQWTYRLVDALYPSRDDMLTRARAALAALARGETPDRAAAYVLLNAVNFARVVNGLAAHFGLPERIHLLAAEPADSARLADALWHTLRPLADRQPGT